jgi:hypothetical protein
MRSVAANGSPQRIFQAVAISDVGRRVAMFRLQPEANRRAVAALEHYRSRLRLNEADRTELGGRLASVLTPEESGNFLAAIARQPVVAANVFTVERKIVGPMVSPARAVFVTQ